MQCLTVPAAGGDGRKGTLQPVGRKIDQHHLSGAVWHPPGKEKMHMYLDAEAPSPGTQSIDRSTNIQDTSTKKFTAAFLKSKGKKEINKGWHSRMIGKKEVDE